MRSLRLALVGTVVVMLLAVGGAGANLLLLRLTRDASDPVGRLSPRAVFPAQPAPAPAPPPSVTTAGAEHHGPDD